MGFGEYGDVVRLGKEKALGACGIVLQGTKPRDILIEGWWTGDGGQGNSVRYIEGQKIRCQGTGDWTLQCKTCDYLSLHLPILSTPCIIELPTSHHSPLFLCHYKHYPLPPPQIFVSLSLYILLSTIPYHISHLYPLTLFPFCKFISSLCCIDLDHQLWFGLFLSYRDRGQSFSVSSVHVCVLLMVLISSQPTCSNKQLRLVSLQ